MAGTIWGAGRDIMFYNYAELEDGTQTAHSNVLDDGTVEVSIE